MALELRQELRLSQQLVMTPQLSAFAAACCVWSISISGHATFGFSALGGFIALAVVVHVVRKSKEA